MGFSEPEALKRSYHFIIPKGPWITVLSQCLTDAVKEEVKVGLKL